MVCGSPLRIARPVGPRPRGSSAQVIRGFVEVVPDCAGGAAGGHRFGGVVLRDADPGHAVAARLDDGPAHLGEQLRLAFGVHQHFIAAAQGSQGAVQALQRALGFPLLGDVDKAGANQPRACPWQPDQRHAAQTLVPRRIADAALEGEFLAGHDAGVVLGEGIRDRPRVGLFRRIKMPRPVLDDFAARAREQPLGRLVRVGQAVPVDIIEQDRVGRLLDHQPKARFAGPQVFIGAPALGDVVTGAAHVGRLAGLVAEDVAARMDDPLVPVRPQNAECDIVRHVLRHARVERVRHALPLRHATRAGGGAATALRQRRIVRSPSRGLPNNGIAYMQMTDLLFNVKSRNFT